MYGCSEVTDFDKSSYEGTIHKWWSSSYKGFPKVFNYDVFEMNPLPELDVTGNNGSPAEAFPLGACEGDCDDDGDCKVRIEIDTVSYNISKK